MTSHYVTLALIIIVCFIFPVFIPFAVLGGIIGFFQGWNNTPTDNIVVDNTVNEEQIKEVNPRPF